MNFNSSNIKVYPAANRDFISGKLNLEYNITNLVNRLTDTPCFIISGLDVLYNNNQLTIKAGECNIGGYFIKILADQVFAHTLSTTADSFVKLSISVNNKNIESSYSIYELNGNDTTTYSGVQLTVDTTEVAVSKSTPFILPIAKINKGTFEVTKLNDKVKYDITYIQIDPNEIDSSVTNKPSDPTELLPKTTFIDWLNNDFILDDGEI